MNISQLFVTVIAVLIIGALFFNSAKALSKIEIIPDEKLDSFIVSTEPWAKLMNKIRTMLDNKNEILKPDATKQKAKEQVSDRVKRLRKEKAKQDFMVTTFFEAAGLFWTEQNLLPRRAVTREMTHGIFFQREPR